MGRLSVARRDAGRPGARPGRVLGDKAYSSSAIRSRLRSRAIRATIPEPAGQVASHHVLAEIPAASGGDDSEPLQPHGEQADRPV
jgi:hypothetical protein